MERQTHSRRLGVGLESDEITLKVVHRIIHVLRGHGGVDHQAHRDRRSEWIAGERGKEQGVREGEKRVIPPDVVRAWIDPDLVFEPAGRDLIIIVGIAPATDAGRRVIKEGGIEDVLRV